MKNIFYTEYSLSVMPRYIGVAACDICPSGKCFIDNEGIRSAFIDNMCKISS